MDLQFSYWPSVRNSGSVHKLILFLLLGSGVLYARLPQQVVFHSELSARL